MTTTINKKYSVGIIKMMIRGEFLSSNHSNKLLREYYKEVNEKFEEYKEIFEIYGYILRIEENYIYCHPQNIEKRVDRLQRNIWIITLYSVIKEFNNEVKPGDFLYKAQIENAANDSSGAVAHALSLLRTDLSEKINSDKVEYVLKSLQENRFIELTNEERQEYIVLNSWNQIIKIKDCIRVVKDACFNLND